jgi:hypothetical protein
MGRPVMRTFRALQVALVIEGVALALKWVGTCGADGGPVRRGSRRLVVGRVADQPGKKRGEPADAVGLPESPAQDEP